MKKFVLAAIAVSALIVFVFIQPNSSKKDDLKHKFTKSAKIGMGIGTATDRFARFTYEREKLVNPATGEIPQFMRQRELMFAQTISSNAKKMQNDIVDFESRGPYNVGGRTRAFAIDVTDENILLAGSISGGVWKSIDGGENWYKVSTSNENVAVTTIVQDTRPGHTSDWYFGTGELFGASQSGTGAFFLGNGVYKSTDGGESWESLPMTASETPQTFDDVWDGIWRIAIDPSNMDQTEIYVATYSTIYRTINGGTSWTPVLTSSLAGDVSYFTEVVVSSTGVVYAGMSSENDIISFGLSPIGGLWRSETGENFVDITSPDFPPTFGRIVLGLNPSNEDQIYVLASNVDPAFGKEGDTPIQEPQYCALWKYEYLDGDGTGSGGDWTELTDNLFVGPNDFDDFYPQSGYNLMVSVKPDDENTVFVGATNLFRSTDGFTTADNVSFIGGYAIGTAMPIVRSYPNHHSDQHGVAFLPSNPNVMYSYNDGGVSRTDDVMATDIVNWETLNNGYISTQFYAIAIDPTDTNNLVMGGLQDNGTFFTDTKSDTVPWRKPYGADGGFCAIMDNGESFIVSTQSGRLLKTKIGETRDLNEYERFDPALPRDEFEFINPWTMDPVSRDALFMPIGNKLWVRENLSDITFTNSWDSTSVGWNTIPDSLVTRQFRSIEASKIPYGLVYLGTDQRNVFKVNDIYSSNPQFIDITDEVNMPDGNVEDIAVDPRNGNKVLIGYSNYQVYSLFYSEDAGENWIKVAGNLEQFPTGAGNGPSIRSVNILPIDDETTHYFVGTSTGIYHTNELIADATEWTRLSEDLVGNSIVSDIKSRATDGYVAIGTHGFGMFSANTPEDPLPPIVGLDSFNEVSNLTAFPNPASNLINVKFNTAKGRPYNIHFFDVLGRKLDLREKQNNSFGMEVNLQYDISHLANGIYYYAVETDGFKQTKSFVVK